MSNIKTDGGEEDDADKDVAAEFGYDGSSVQYDDEQEIQVRVNETVDSELKNLKSCRSTDPKLGFIKPEPSQILTVFLNTLNQSPIHIDMDSGASLNYTEEEEAIQKGYKIYPNGQLSKLGDGVTKLKSYGEIHETFFRNGCSIKWRSLVSKQLTAPYIGGTVFMKDNQIVQDLVKDVIHLLDKKITVKPTDPINLLPTEPTFKTYDADPKIQR